MVYHMYAVNLHNELKTYTYIYREIIVKFGDVFNVYPACMKSFSELFQEGAMSGGLAS